MHSAIRSVLFVFTAALFTIPVNADNARLRSVIGLPKISANVQLNLLLSDSSREAKSPEEILKLLKGDLSDAEVYMRLASAYDTNVIGNDIKVRDAYQKAAPLLSQALAKSPKDGLLMSQLGVALAYGSRDAGAEKLLREAVKASPAEWRCWANLGDYIQSSSLSIILGQEKGVPVSSVDPLTAGLKIRQLISNQKLGDAVATLESASKEAKDALDHAVSLAQNSPEVYNRRFSFWLTESAITQNVLRAAKGQEQDYSRIISDAALADKWKAADLSPDDPMQTGGAIVYELLASIALLEPNHPVDKETALSKLPPTTKVHVQDGLKRLAAIAESRDQLKATQACVAESCAFVVMADYSDAAAAARSALKISPTNSIAQQALDASLVSLKQFSELSTALNEQIKQSDSPFLRLFLVKCYYMLGKHSEEMEALNSAITTFPDDLLLNIAMGDEMMKSTEEGALNKAGQAISRCQAIFDKLPEDQKKQRQAEFDCLRGIYLGLIGKPDVARIALQHVLQYDPSNEDARAALDALGSELP